MLDKRQRKRLLIFLVIPILAAGLFISDDLTIRIIIIALLVIYVAFIIFLRDSIRFSGGYSIEETEEPISESVSTAFLIRVAYISFSMRSSPSTMKALICCARSRSCQ